MNRCTGKRIKTATEPPDETKRGEVLTVKMRERDNWFIITERARGQDEREAQS